LGAGTAPPPADLAHPLTPPRRPRPGGAGLEDGTIPFLALPAALRGFEFVHLLGGFDAVARHAERVASALAGRLSALRHAGGQAACILYGAHVLAEESAEEDGPPWSSGGALEPGGRLWRRSISGQGPVVAFSLLRPDGTFVGYRRAWQLQ
jgi:molybdenum cofactor sulfurtransferase